MNCESCLVAVYARAAQASDAARQLREHGFPAHQVFVIGTGPIRGPNSSRAKSPAKTRDPKGRNPKGLSAAGLYGRLFGISSVLFPGFGPKVVALQAELTFMELVDRCVDRASQIAWIRLVVTGQRQVQRLYFDGGDVAPHSFAPPTEFSL